MEDRDHRDFAEGLAFFRRVAEIAEAEDHHPDLHLVGYRNVSIEISTHAVVSCVAIPSSPLSIS